ncbi:MAG: hypothetical protein WAM79_04030 [Candidatus Sulfotelmatobacter sp.]
MFTADLETRLEKIVAQQLQTDAIVVEMVCRSAASTLDPSEVSHPAGPGRWGFFSHRFDVHRIPIIADSSVYNASHVGV